MNKSDVRGFIQRLNQDEKFKELFFDDPAKALETFDFQVSDDNLMIIKEQIEKIRNDPLPTGGVSKPIHVPLQDLVK
ncbi:MAG: hypothetical protein RQ754_13240 [Desulfuromonadales bacterium]|nr:hypothetical protein [Desulfuromonadales bacterium]